MLVLAGGFGTRLRSVLEDVPKALAPVDSMPFLHYQIEHWMAQGIRSFSFLLHHQADLIIQFLEARRDGLLFNCQIDWLREPEPMDTGGAVAYAVKNLKLSEEFLVCNADTWLGSGIQSLADTGANAMAVIARPDVSRYGEVEFDDLNRVIAFREKGNSSGSGWINAGMSILNPANFQDWDGQPFSLERDFFPRLLHTRALKAVPLDTEFIDIGIPADYERFSRWQSTGRKGNLWN